MRQFHQRGLACLDPSSSLQAHPPFHRRAAQSARNAQMHRQVGFDESGSVFYAAVKQSLRASGWPCALHGHHQALSVAALPRGVAAQCAHQPTRVLPRALQPLTQRAAFHGARPSPDPHDLWIKLTSPSLPKSWPEFSWSATAAPASFYQPKCARRPIVLQPTCPPSPG